jgi:hypothetical protein
MTAKELMQQKGEFVATGIIKAINGEKDKLSKKGWQGTRTEVTLDINGRKQKITVFGGTGKNETKVRVFQKDTEGKILKDAEGKAIQHQINPSEFNPQTFAYFDMKEVLEWGERGEDGKAQKIEYIKELTDGRFANALLDNKDLLIGKRVLVRGDVTFKPTQNYDKIQTDMSIKQIVIQQPLEEGKEVVDKFILNASLIVNKEAIEETVNGYLPVYVPVYHKYVKPIIRDGKEVKGRTVYVPTTFTVKENGFMNIDESFGYPLADRKDMFVSKVTCVTGDEPFSVMRACISNKSGVVEREIKIEELLDDQVYGKFAKRAIDEGTVENFLEVYKKQNPLTVRGEYKQEIDFISPLQMKDEDSVNAREAIFPIDFKSIEVYSLDKIKEEVETQQTQTPQSQEIPKVNTPSKKVQEAPMLDVNSMTDLDSFPF